MPGIYEIWNTKTGRRYIGSTTRVFPRRWREHTNLLNAGKHNGKLQQAWNDYGPEVWAWRVLEETSIKGLALTQREQYWIDLHDVYFNGYNDNPIAKRPPSWKGKKRTEEDRKKKSKALKGRSFPHMFVSRPVSESQKLKLSLARKGKSGWKPSKKTNQKRSKALKGRTFPHMHAPKSVAHRKKLSESNKRTKAAKKEV